MSNEFEPYPSDGKSGEFSVWEYTDTQSEEPPEISPQELFLNECEQLRQEAISKGYAEGCEQAQAELDAQKSEWQQWIELIKKPVQLLDDKLVQEVIETVTSLCKYCIGVELSVHPEKLSSLFSEIKNELPSLQGNKILTMNPEDLAWIKTKFDEKEIPGLHDILAPDPSLNRGDFYLKGEYSELDGRIQKRFATLFAKYIDKDTVLPPSQPQE